MRRVSLSRLWLQHSWKILRAQGLFAISLFWNCQFTWKEGKKIVQYLIIFIRGFASGLNTLWMLFGWYNNFFCVNEVFWWLDNSCDDIRGTLIKWRRVEKNWFFVDVRNFYNFLSVIVGSTLNFSLTNYFFFPIFNKE